MMVVHNDTFDSEDRQHSEILEIVSPILTSVLINNDLAYVMKLAMKGFNTTHGTKNCSSQYK